MIERETLDECVIHSIVADCCSGLLAARKLYRGLISSYCENIFNFPPSFLQS